MKVYKITLYTSLIVFSILTVLSVVLNFWNDNVWFSFINDWCVGIACSVIVVVITTFIQFKTEQKKSINELASAVRMMLFQNLLGGDAFGKDAKKEMSARQIDSLRQIWKKELEESAENISKICFGLEFFFKKKEMFLIRKNSLFIQVEVVKDEPIEDIYIRSQENIYEIAEAVLALRFADYNREEIEKYVKEYREKT